LKIVICFALIFLCSLSHFENLYSWTNPFRIDDNTQGLTNTFPAIAVDRQNRSHVVWRSSCSDTDNIYYRYNIGPDYTIWSEKVNLSNNAIPYSTLPDIEIDWQGRPHVAWCTWGSTDIWWTYYDSVWQSPVNISNNPSGSQHPQFASDTTNKKLYLVWDDTRYGSFEILMKVFEGDTWGATQRVTYEPASCTDPNITVDSNGDLHLVYRNSSINDIHYCKFEGDSWTSPENISNIAGQSGYPYIAIDSFNRPNVVWEERSGGYKIYYTIRKNNGLWTQPLLLSQSQGAKPVIAIDNNGRICVIWGWSNGQHYKIYENGNWSNDEIFDSLSGWPDISVDKENVFHSAYGKYIINYFYVYYSRHEDLGVNEKEKAIAGNFHLQQNFPNPFSNETIISFSLKNPEKICIVISDVGGRIVYKKNFGVMNSGHYQISISCNQLKGGGGIYFLRAEAGRQSTTKKIIWLNN